MFGLLNVDWLIEAEWRICASVDQTKIGSDKSLSSLLCQAITLSNVDFSAIGSKGANLRVIWFEIP